MKLSNFLLGWVCLMFMNVMSGQSSDLDLADYYYKEGMYEQARLYYERIYKTNKTAKVHNNYLNTLIALNDFEEAEKIAKKRIKEDNKDGVAYLKLGELYKKFNKGDEAKENFDEAVKRVEPHRSAIIRLANEFSLISEYTYALKTYEKGAKEGRDNYNYAFEIANVKGNLGDHSGMLDSFFDLLEGQPNYLQSVQNTIHRLLDLEENPQHVEMLRVKLLKRVQTNTEQTVFSELLAWLLLQKKDFSAALTQLIAIDKRLGENGSRLMNLGQLASGNGDYTTAETAYQAVIDKGRTSEYYMMARLEILQVMTARLEADATSEKSSYEALAKLYESAITELGKNGETAVMIKELAHLKAFHLNKTEEAMALLNDAIVIPGAYAKTVALCKLELGDISLFNGDVWDASLLYSQVELEFKEDAMGHEAKFRNAKISYYSGDFEWSQGQLDVLKASTSKLIANDAMDLSLLITDNFNMDTTLLPMQMFARASLLAYQNRFDACDQVLDSILVAYPAHTLVDEIKMMQAENATRRHDFSAAIALYNYILEFHFTDITADDALFRLAELQQNALKDNEKAKTLYEKLITDFPGSLFVVEARKRYRALRGDGLN
jgi:tetratricopeptide (TPR) repeat protein